MIILIRYNLKFTFAKFTVPIVVFSWNNCSNLPDANFDFRILSKKNIKKRMHLTFFDNRLMIKV